MKYRIVTAFLAILLSVDSFAATILIDDFSVPGIASPLTQNGPGTVMRTTTDIGLLGGSRDETLTVVDLGGSETTAQLFFKGNMVFTQGSNDQAVGSLTYGDFSGFDLTDSGTNTHLAMGFRANDIDLDVPNVLSLTAVSGSNSSTQSLTIPASSLLPLDVFVDFADFTGVDFTQLDSLTMSFDTASAAGRDFELDFFSGSNPSAAPEPSSIVFLIIGAGGLLFRRRRR